MKLFWKIVAGVLGGVIVGILGAMLAALTFGGDNGGGAFVALWLLGMLMAILSKSGGKAWRKLLFLSAALSLALPLSTIVFSGRTMAEVETGAEAVGTAIGGGIVTIFAGVVGFFLALIFLVLALLIGRAPVEVRVVETVQVTEEKDKSS